MIYVNAFLQLLFSSYSSHRKDTHMFSYKSVFLFTTLLLCSQLILVSAYAQVHEVTEERVIIKNENWELVGDLVIPSKEGKLPFVLMLNQADGERGVYVGLAKELADRGIGSLRVDLRGHGESINAGKFIPGENRRDPKIWDAEKDVIALYAYMKRHNRIDSEKIAIIGASYSGEEMAEAGRLSEYAKAYVALSPGSFSEESIDGIDSSGVPWLFVAASQDRFVRDIITELRDRSNSVELVAIPGGSHATNILQSRSDMVERIAVWLVSQLM